ncbi:MAG: DUF4271 domain-containing protein [Flavobacteriales bacterium]
MPPDALRAIDPFNAEWVTIVLVLALSLLALINVSAPRKWGVLAQALFRLRLGRQVLRDEVDLRDRALWGLLLPAVSVLALFAWQLDTLWWGSVAHSYVEWLGLVVLVIGGQLVLNGALARVINDRGVLMEHSYTGLLLHVLAGMLLFPVVALVAYRAEWRIEVGWLGLGLLGLLLLYRWFRGGWLGLSEGASGHHILLYLCAAEVLPALLLVSSLHAG